MCGIAGVASLDAHRGVEKPILERMNAAQSHRGPDDAGIWLEGAVGLAHRRLSILDPTPAGHQPMMSRDGQWVIVYNGEIYNFQEIRLALEHQGCCFQTRCDTEVLLEAFRVWGDAALDRLNGIFAFGVYNRARRRLVLARDRLGVKPLFYTEQSGVLAFSSELGALRAGGFTRPEVNAPALDAYFSFQYIPAPDTIYRGVHKLRPGEKLVVEHGRVSVETYWRLAYQIDLDWTLDRAAEIYRGLVIDAIRLQRVSDVPLGAFLSGGIDSSTVVGVLSAQSERAVSTFTIGFEDPQRDELGYARMAAERFHTDHREEILRPDMMDLTERLARHFAEPFADSSALPMWLVSQIARQQVKVALSGDGGDELFAGYTWTHMNHRVGQYRRVPETLRRLIATALSAVPRSPGLEKLRRFSSDSFLSADQSFRRRLTMLSPEARAGLYTREFSEQLSRYAVDRFTEHLDACRNQTADDQMLYLDSVQYLPDDILVKVDRMSMAHGLEARVPLLDHRIVEFAATVPFSMKYGGGISKRLAKYAFRDLLPPALIRQRKQGFSIPIHRWFRAELREYFTSRVLHSEARCRRYLEAAAVQRIFDQHQEGREDYGHPLWAILMFEQWLREQENPLN